MIYSVAFGSLILLCTSLVGYIFASRIPRVNPFLHISTFNLLGMAILVWASSLAELIGISFLIPFQIIIGFSGIFFLVKVFLSRSKLVKLMTETRDKFLILPKFLFALGLGVLAALLHNPGLLSSRMSLRVGPDLVGWTASTKYFSENISRTGIIESISKQLSIDDVKLAFRSPILFPETYISKIPSFTDQATGEFLVGAGRVGIPKLLATFCNLSPERLNNVMVGGIVWAVFITSFLVIGIFEERMVSVKTTLAITFLSTFNVNTISVLMEGGYGQFLSTPFLIAAVYFLLDSRYKGFAILQIFIFLAFALNAYQDAIIVFFVITGIYCLVHYIAHFRQGSFKFRLSSKLALAIILFLTLNSHQFSGFFRLVFERVNSNGVMGGWDQQKIAFPVNLLGVFNWLPFSQANHPWGFGLFLIVALTSALGMAFMILAAARKIALLVPTLFLAFLILNYLVYGQQLDTLLYRNGLATNNYQIWKFMAYATPLILLIIFSADYSNLRIGTRSILQRTGKLVLVLAVISSVTWSMDWIKYRTFTFELQKNFESEILDKYDVVAIGKLSGSTISLILEGDVRYFSETRAFGLSTLRSIPSREIVYLLPKGQCIQFSCLTKAVAKSGLIPPSKFEVVYKNEDFTVFSGVKNGSE